MAVSGLSPDTIAGQANTALDDNIGQHSNNHHNLLHGLFHPMQTLGHVWDQIHHLHIESQLSKALKLISSLYAVIMVLLGLIFPASEALRGSWLETYYNGVFLVYMYVIAIGFLILLQVYIIPASSKKTAARKQMYDSPPKTALPDNVLYQPPFRNRTMSESSKSQPPFRNRTMSESSKSQPPFRNRTMSESSKSQPPFRNRTMSESSKSSRVISLSKTIDANNNGNDKSSEKDTSFDNAWNKNFSRMDSSFSQPQQVNVDNHKHPEEESHEGSSFYLRLGMLFFGIGNMIYVILEIDYRLVNVPEGCPTDRFGWTFVLKLVFLIVQTFFLFKNPMVHITVCKRIYDFGCKHVLATNLCIWIRTLISEIEEAFLHSGYNDENHGATEGYTSSTTSNVSICYLDGKLIYSARPYLFPFVLEYSLIAMGVFAVMTNGIRHVKMQHHHHHHHHHHHITDNPKTKEIEDDVESVETSSTTSSDSESDSSSHFGPMQVKRRGVVNLNFKNANKGLFFGVLVLAGAVVSIVLFFFEANDGNKVTAQMNYLISDLTLHTFMLMATLYSIYALSKLKMKHMIHIQVDDILLLVAMSGSFIFEISVVISSSVYLSNSRNTTLTSLSLCSATIAVIQTISQTILVTNGLRRQCTTLKQQEQTPGKETITFLIVCNITVWIVRTFQVKELEMGIQEEFYGTLAWLFILNLNLPLLLFFHFHCSVCLADIWVEAYVLKEPHEIEHMKPNNYQSGVINTAFNIEIENSSPINRSNGDVNNNNNNNQDEVDQMAGHDDDVHAITYM